MERVPDGEDDADSSATRAGGEASQDAADGNERDAPALDPAMVAGMTEELAMALNGIKDEMNRLKAELYSEDGGLGGLSAQLDELRAQAGSLVGDEPSSPGGAVAGGTSASGCGGVGAAGGSACSSSGRKSAIRQELRERRAAQAGSARPDTAPSAASSAAGASAGGAPTSGSACRGSRSGSRTGRRVEFEPGTPDPAPQAQLRRRWRGGARRPPPQAGWSPYIVCFVLICLGPLRPLLLQIASEGLATFREWRERRGGTELAWFDDVDD